MPSRSWSLYAVFLLVCTAQLVLGSSEKAERTIPGPKGSHTHSLTPSAKGAGGSCYKGDLVCEKDKLGYEAIATLHHQMDDDNNGDIDLEESAEFLIEELQYSKSYWSEHRRRNFHMNDTHITVDDLWNIWKNSSVHNWTIENVVTWLTYEVELPQYSDTFKMNAVDGSTLPRLAVNNLNFVSNILGIKNLVHKQKLANKATDVVLFGPPKSRHNWFKDVALVTAVAVAAGGCWYAFRQNRQLEINMARTMRDMESLAKSEVALKQLQEKLECEKLEKRQHMQYKEELEQKVQQEISEARLEAQRLKLTKEQTETQLSHFKETIAELDRMKQALAMAQKELEVRNSLAPSKELRKWLQITYELELKAYNEKKLLAEQQLSNAKESCERLRKKKQALFGSLRMVNSSYLDETENIIVIARKAMEEVKHDLAERQYRWQQIENMCSFSIISNPGLRALILSTGHTDLYRHCHGGSLLEAGSTDLEDADDVPPAYGAVLAAMQCNGYTLGRKSRYSSSSLSSLQLASTQPGSPVNKTSATLGNKHIFRTPPQSTVGSLTSGPPSTTGSPSTTGPPSTTGLSSTRSPPSAGSSRANSEEPAAIIGDLVETQMQTEVEADPVANGKVTMESPESPHFTLYGEEPDSSSSSDNSHIPKVRPKLQRHPVLRDTDNMSVCSEQAPVNEDVLTAVRPRTSTNELPTASLAKSKRAHTVHSPLTHNMSSSEVAVSKVGVTMKRSCTTDLPAIKSKTDAPLSVSTDFITHQSSAPAGMSGLDDSDTSMSSGSKDSLTKSTRRVKKKTRILNIFKMKPKTS